MLREILDAARDCSEGYSIPSPNQVNTAQPLAAPFRRCFLRLPRKVSKTLQLRTTGSRRTSTMPSRPPLPVRARQYFRLMFVDASSQHGRNAGAWNRDR